MFPVANDVFPVKISPTINATLPAYKFSGVIYLIDTFVPTTFALTTNAFAEVLPPVIISSNENVPRTPSKFNVYVESKVTCVATFPVETEIGFLTTEILL